MIERQRLLRRLAEDDSRTVLLCAPSGYGKTVLLQQWAAVDPRRTYSLLLSERHNDPTALVKAVVRAFEAGEPFPEDLKQGLTAPHPDIHNVILPRLESSIASRREPFVLILDELERIESPESLAVVGALCLGAPAGSQVALASRTEPDIRLARMRTSRRLTELRREDLTMTKSECVALIESLEIRLKPKQVDALVLRTEGWPAAIYLAGAALRESADPGPAIEHFSGDDRHLVDYIREEFLLSVSGQRLDFLLRSSVLERMNGELCDSVLGLAGSASVLRELSRSNMLVIPLDRRDEWFRFHPLLRKMLHAELMREDPAAERDLHLKASRWWQEQGDWDFAIQHAVDAGATGRAGELLWAATPEYMTRGRNATVLGWLTSLGPNRIEMSTGLSLTATWAQITFGRGPEAERWAATTRRLFKDEPASEHRLSLEGGLALVDATLCRDGIEEMHAAIGPARRLLPADSPWTTICSLLDGVYMHLSRDLKAARRHLREGVRRGSVSAPNLQALCLAQLALVEADEGAWHEAERSIGQARAQVDRVGLGEYPMIALVFAVSAAVRALRGTIDSAAADFAVGRKRLAELDEFAPWYECETELLLARAAMRLGDANEARRLLDLAVRDLDQVGETSALHRWAAETEAELGARAAAVDSSLTVAELRVLQFLPSHLSFPQIAGKVFLSPNTVKSHVRSIYQKLGVSSRDEAIARARRAGLLDAEDQREL